jgi:uncharacterized membrane protein YedE/YeeE
MTPDNLLLPGFPWADPVAGLTGGIMIGLAAAIMLLGLGRIAGVSGIAARALGLTSQGMSRAVAIAFLAGLPIGAFILFSSTGIGGGEFPSSATLLVAGLVVGFGTRLGSGCTSGHGVCGISRLSARSMLATITFIAAGMATVLAMNLAGVTL